MQATAKAISLRNYISRLIWLSLLPLIVLVAWFGLEQARQRESESLQTAEHAAARIRDEVDHFLQMRLAALSMLAQSPLLDLPSRLDAFHQRALDFQRDFGGHLILADARLQMLLNTRVPFGTPLPQLPQTSGAAAPKVLATGKPHVGDIVPGPVAQQSLVALVIPVLREDTPPRLLLATYELNLLQQLIEGIPLPKGQMVRLIDGQGATIASHGAAAAAGQAGPVRPFTASSALSAWRVVLEVPERELDAPFREALAKTAIYLLLATLVGWAGGHLAGRRLGTAVRALSQEGDAAQAACAIEETCQVRHLIETQSRQLLFSEQRYRSLFENDHTVMLLIDPADGRIVDANPAAAHFYGWSREALKTMFITQINILPKEEIARQLAGVRESSRNVFHFRHRLANDEIRDVEVHTGPVRMEGRLLLYSIVLDETERLATQRALEQALRVVEASPVVSFRWLAKTGWPVEYVSNNISRWGYRPEDIRAGRPTYAEIIHPDDLPRVRSEVDAHMAAGDARYTQTYRIRAADGRYFWVEDNSWLIHDGQGKVIAYEGVVTDIDERKRYEQQLTDSLAEQKTLNRKLEAAQNQLVHAEKMASIGQLAAGVAHELNNPIGFITSNLNTLETYLTDLFAIADAYAHAELAYGMESPPFERARTLKEEKDYDFLRSDILALLQESKEGLARVARIVRDLKDFSHPGSTAMQWADLHAGLDSTLNIVWNELKYKCTVIKRYGELPQVWCDIAQLNQVFMNLLVNASHAIAEKGEITITTGRQGDRVFVAISDTGSGIAPENLKRIFDPFFTTKPVGKGTGLGLSLAYSIVQKHRGSIEVQSELGKGTTFTVWLPIAPPEPAAGAVPPAPTLEST